MPVKAHAGILHTNRGVIQLWPIHLIGGAVLVPHPGRGANPFGLASDECALPGRECEDSRVAKAAKSRYAAFQLIGAFWQRERILDQFTSFLRRLGGVRR